MRSFTGHDANDIFWIQIEIFVSTYRHFRIVEPNVINSSTRQMNPPVFHAFQNYRNRHIKIENQIYWMSFLQLFRLLQRSRESCTNANYLFEFSCSRVVVARSRSKQRRRNYNFVLLLTVQQPIFVSYRLDFFVYHWDHYIVGNEFTVLHITSDCFPQFCALLKHVFIYVYRSVHGIIFYS